MVRELNDLLPLWASGTGFMPHGHCLRWTPSLLWSYVVADGTIALAYFSIPWWLLSFARQRPDMPLRMMLLLFGVFITACGATHLIEVWNLWHADYWPEVVLKGLTACASAGTAVVMWRLMPAALALPSPTELQELNRSLERRVLDRTHELQQSNAALEEERARLTAVIEMAMDAIITMDGSQNILVFNRAAEAMFGYDSAEVTGRPLTMLMPARYRDAHPQLVAAFARDTAGSRRMGARNAIIGLRRDDEEFPMEASISRMEVSGTPYFTVIIRDVSTRMRAEASLRWLAGIVESSGDAIISESPEGRITSWNDAACALLGWSAEEMIGQSLERVIPAEFAATGARMRQRLGEGEAVKPFDTHRIHKDGSLVQVSVTLSPVRDLQGELTGFSAITRDISERRRMENDLKTALREQQTLLKEVYHRVKNNLQVVTSLLNLQLRHLPAGLARDTLEESANRVRSMALVHEMLYQSHDLSSIDLLVYIQDLCSQLSMAHNAAARGIRFEIRGDSVQVSLDLAVPLGLSLNELIANSLKHGFGGRSEGVVRVQLTRLPDTRIRLEVWDDGIGFQPVDSGASRHSLGLQLVESLSRQIDASLQMEARAGAYTRMEFAVAQEELLQQ